MLQKRHGQYPCGQESSILTKVQLKTTDPLSCVAQRDPSHGVCCAAGVLKHTVTSVPACPHLHTSLVLGHVPSGELQFFHLEHPDSPLEGSASPLPGYVLFLKQLLLSLYLEASGAGSAGIAARPAKLHRSRLTTAKPHPMDASARVWSSSAAKTLLLLPASFCSRS